MSENNGQTDLPIDTIDTTDINVSESEPDVSEAADEMSAYYGHYRIKKFCFTQYYSALKYDCLPDQEADLLLGQIVVLEPDLLVTFDSERSLGTRGGRDAFDGNYAIETYQIAHPQYNWMSFDTDLGELWWLKPDFDMDWAVEDTYFNQLDGVIAIPQLCEPYGTQYYYTMEGSDNLILFSTLTMQYFLLERCGESPEQALPELTEQEKEELLTEVYGEYQVTEFLPTKFYPALDSSRCIILPEEEAELMLGQYITLSEELFVTYDNCRLPNSVIVQRPEDEYRLEKIEIQEPEYRMERRRYDEIYGIRDDMLPDELCQQEYVEIDVYPGYGVTSTRVLPQLFLMEDGRLLMYSMGEYFLLEKAERETSGSKIGETVIDISYPYFHTRGYPDLYAWEYPDPAVIDKINRMIEQEIKDHCDIELCAYEISYEIKCENEDIFSVLFEEMYSAWGAAHPNSIAWGLTFDMNTGELLRAEDVIELSWLQHKIEQKEYEQVRGIGMQYYEETARVENWYEEKYEGHSMDYYDEEHYHDYYLTDDKIGIIFGVSHAVGDYIFIEIEK